MVMIRRTCPGPSPPPSPGLRRCADGFGGKRSNEAKPVSSGSSKGSNAVPSGSKASKQFDSPFPRMLPPIIGRSKTDSFNEAFINEDKLPNASVASLSHDLGKASKLPVKHESALNLKLEYYFQKIREDNKEGLAQVKAAILEFEHRLCARLHLDSKTTLSSSEPGQPGFGHDAVQLSGLRSPTSSNPASPRQPKEPCYKEPCYSSDGSRSSHSEPSRESSRMKKGLKDSPIYGKRETAGSVGNQASDKDIPRMARAKKMWNAALSGAQSEQGSLVSSKRSQQTSLGDANITDIEKYQVESMMRTDGLLPPDSANVDSVVSAGHTSTDRAAFNLTSLTVNGECHDSTSQGVNLSPRSERSESKSPRGTRGDGRRLSLSSQASNCSLESLRQQNDSLLALSGLTVAPDDVLYSDGVQSFKKPYESEDSNVSNYESSRYYSSSVAGKTWVNAVPWLVLRVCGIIPWRQGSVLSTCYSLFLLLVAATVAAYPSIRIAQGRMVSVHIYTLSFTVSGLVGAVSLRWRFTNLLFTQFPGPLELYSLKHGFAHEFHRGSLQQFATVCCLWVFSVLMHLAGKLPTHDACAIEYDHWTLVCFILGSMLFSVLLYCQLHVICLLCMMVDRYCSRLFLCPDLSQNVLDWNLIQAMLRQIVGAFDFCFMMTQTGSCATLLLVATQMVLVEQLDTGAECGTRYFLPLLLPPVLLALGAFLVLFKAAAVSEKCSRVAPLVNSMDFEDPTDSLAPKRMHIVHFIGSSNAGFYIQEVRITASMAMKLMYLTCLAFFALVTKLATDRDRTHTFA